MADASLISYVKSRMVDLLRSTVMAGGILVDEFDVRVVQRVRDFLSVHAADIDRAVRDMIEDYADDNDLGSLHPDQHPCADWFADYLFDHVEPVYLFADDGENSGSDSE
jgi:hypothetical protein